VGGGTGWCCHCPGRFRPVDQRLLQIGLVAICRKTGCEILAIDKRLHVLMTPEFIKHLLIQKVPSIFKNYPVLFAYLYGSYAAGAVHPFSDVDIAVYIPGSDTKNSLKIELSLSVEIDNLLCGKAQCDVRVINGLPLSFLGQILTEGILIYSRDEVVRVDFETSVRNTYFDFTPVLKLYRQEYLKRSINQSGG